MVYFTHDDHLLNWKRAFIDKEAPKDGHHYRDNYFSFKDVKYCDSNYFIALGYYHIVCDGKSYDLPGWYKMYFDVEKDSKQYKEIKEKNRLQIEEAIQGQKLSKKNE